MNTSLANPRRSFILLALILAFAGCQQKMGAQPAYRPLEPSELFTDGRSSRPLVAGTVPRGGLREDSVLYTGRLSTSASNSSTPGGEETGAGGKPLENYATRFPIPITDKALQHGKERFGIYCSVCHGMAGDGDGPVVLRGFTKPPSYITDDSRGLALRGIHMPLRDVPAGYMFEVITKGYGAMPDYAAQVDVRDRWEIVAYVRALQLSQRATLAQLPEAQRQAAEKALEAQP